MFRALQTRKAKARQYIERRLVSRDYEELSDVLHGAEQELDWAPSRSTFYEWVRQWREARARDRSGTWTLATDETGRPDIVMDVLAALIGSSRGRLATLTVAEARWIVRLATAVPIILKDKTRFRGVDAQGHGIGDPIGPAWGTLNLWEWALQYVDAENVGDQKQLSELDATVAMLYGAGGRHFPEATMGDDQ